NLAALGGDAVGIAAGPFPPLGIDEFHDDLQFCQLGQGADDDFSPLSPNVKWRRRSLFPLTKIKAKGREICTIGGARALY
ncbi:MAG: hypothetical protein QF742_13045, partial [Alphaproteobacteria bacterium]|nr:hypothetical protein [Alphaproteobacteria bacterium]